MKKPTLVIVLLIVYTAAMSQHIKSKECKNLKTGTFYYYPANSGKAFKITRGYLVQAEIDIMPLMILKESQAKQLPWVI